MKRITKQVVLGSKKAKFNVSDYIRGLGNTGSGGYYARRGGNSASPFANTSEHFEDTKTAFNEDCYAKIPKIDDIVSDKQQQAIQCRDSIKKYGFYMHRKLHDAVDEILLSMPYLRLFPYFSANELANKSYPTGTGAPSVGFIHEGDDYPCGAVSWEHYSSRYTLFCPLTSEKRNGKHFTENPERLAALARQYFKYRTPAKIAPFVAFQRAGKTELEGEARDNSYKLRRLLENVNSYGGNKEISKEVYSHLRSLHDQGHVFGDGQLNDLFSEITSRRHEESKYHVLSLCIMYAKMRSDSTVEYSFYYKEPKTSYYTDVTAFQNKHADYDLCSTMYNTPVSGMPPEFIVPMSQLALEEPAVIVEGLGVRINQYEYVLYSNGVEDILDEDAINNICAEEMMEQSLESTYYN
jgi:hypothetical protein